MAGRNNPKSLNKDKISSWELNLFPSFLVPATPGPIRYLWHRQDFKLIITDLNHITAATALSPPKTTLEPKEFQRWLCSTFDGESLITLSETGIVSIWNQTCLSQPKSNQPSSEFKIDSFDAFSPDNQIITFPDNEKAIIFNRKQLYEINLLEKTGKRIQIPFEILNVTLTRPHTLVITAIDSQADYHTYTCDVTTPDCWKQLSQLRSLNQNMIVGCALLEERLLVIGEYNRNTLLYKPKIYRLEANKQLTPCKTFEDNLSRDDFWSITPIFGKLFYFTTRDQKKCLMSYDPKTHVKTQLKSFSSEVYLYMYNTVQGVAIQHGSGYGQSLEFFPLADPFMADLKEELKNAHNVTRFPNPITNLVADYAGGYYTFLSNKPRQQANSSATFFSLLNQLNLWINKPQKAAAAAAHEYKKIPNQAEIIRELHELIPQVLENHQLSLKMNFNNFNDFPRIQELLNQATDTLTPEQGELVEILRNIQCLGEGKEFKRRP